MIRQEKQVKSIISSGQEAAYSASSKAMLLTYWNIGKRIVEQELGGSERAEYGRGLISALAEDLTKEFGKNYSKRNLHYYIKFYQCFPDEQIVNACVHNLNWTHIRSLLRVTDENARYWYMKEAVTFLFLMVLIRPLLIMSYDYTDYLDCGDVPPEGSQYWVASFVSQFFEKYKNVLDENIINYLRENTEMQI